MSINPRFPNPVARVLAIVPVLLAVLAVPALAAVTTVYNCASGGIGGNHDYVYNGFFVQNVNATNLHSVQLYYTTDTPGNYNLTFTVHTGGYAGPVVGTQTQNLALNSASDYAATWTFADPAITSATTLYFEHTGGAAGGAKFSTSLSVCARNVEIA